MKYQKFLFSFFVVLACTCAFFSCASMQQDVSASISDESVDQNTAEVAISFITIDGKILNNEKVENSDIDKIVAKIDAQLEKTRADRSVKARLTALKGLCFLHRKNTSRAETFYKQAAELQKDDAYVIILNNRLIKDREQALSELSAMDLASAPLLQLEQALVFYTQDRYSDSVAAIDAAFLMLDEEYRTAYSAIRETAWQIHSLGSIAENIDEQSKISLTAPLDVNTMITLTQNNSSLLTSFLGGSTLSTKALLEKLALAGYLSSAKDANDDEGSSIDIIMTNPLTRILCSRFLWNLYVQKRGDVAMRTKYSDRYAKRANATSPIPDVPLSSPDFDSVIGCVESELMDLPDGINFKPDEAVTTADFLGYLNAVEK